MTMLLKKQHQPISAQWFGIVAALITIFVWASWLLSMKVGVQSHLSHVDLAILRFGITGVLLLPIFFKNWASILAAPKRYLLGISVGAGIPFFYLSSMGMKMAPVADAGLLITGTFPLFVTFAAVVFYKEKLTLQRTFGLSAILIGVTVMISLSLLSGNETSLRGNLIFLIASMSWALFTVSLKLSGLKPWDAAAWLCVSSSAILGVGIATDIFSTRIISAPVETILHQGIVQVLCVGLITGFSYGFAVRQLGAENTSAIGAFTPVLAVIGGIVLLGEQIDPLTWAGLACITAGVILASGFRFNVSLKNT